MSVDHRFGLLPQLPRTIAVVVGDAFIWEPTDAARVATIAFRDAGTLSRLSATPSMLAFGEAFIAGDVDVDGDLEAVVAAGYAADVAGGAMTAPRGARPSEDEAIRFHYDLPPEFFALFLDSRLLYTCAYFADDAFDLEAAQRAKLDLVCRKLRLRPGDRLLDVGCGWGGLVAWAAERHDADVLGVTLSSVQCDYARAMLDGAGLAGRAEVVRRHYRDLAPDGGFDRIAAVGVLEHVGPAHYAEFFARCAAALRPGGILLNHCITRSDATPPSSGATFLDRHVFPGGELGSLATIVARLESAGFRILDAEALGAHYARTTALWLQRLQVNADRARALVGERRYRTWCVYLAAAAVAFRAGWIDLHQVVATRPAPEGVGDLERRGYLYRAPFDR